MIGKTGMTIFIATHKPVNITPIDGYSFIEVGATLKNHFTEITDDSGDNISAKNPNYCELTAQYWIWKNRSDRYVGLCHYRRYFYKWPQYIARTILGIKTSWIDVKSAERILERYDAIVTLPCFLSKTVWERYRISHYIEDLEKARNIIEERYPEYMEAFHEAMSRKKYHYGNMIICNKAIFDTYSEWLFDILFEVEKHTDLSGRPPYQQRAYGFLSERLMDVFLIHNKIRIKELPVIVTDEPFLFIQIVHFIKRKIGRLISSRKK